MKSRQVLAFAGGGWVSSEPGSPVDSLVLSLAGTRRPRVCVIPTATGDQEPYLEAVSALFASRADVSVLRLFHRDVSDIEGFLCEQDVIHVQGGNTLSLLAVWRAHGVDTALRAAYDAGVLLTGVSAGMNCWFEASMTDSYLLDTSRPLVDGLGFLAGSCSPHYDSEPSRRPSYLAAVADGFPAGVAGEDHVAFHYVDEELREVVSDREGARAFRVSVGASGEVVEEPLAVRRLT